MTRSRSGDEAASLTEGIVARRPEQPVHRGDDSTGARWDAADRAYAAFDDRSLAAAQFIAVVSIAAMRELRSVGHEAVRGVADLVRTGWCTSVTVDRKECFELDDYLKQVVLEHLDAERRAELIAQSASIRESFGVLDCGLRAAWQASDWMACGRIIDRWGPNLTFSSFRPLSQHVLFAMPLNALRAWPGAWHRAEYLGILPLGEAPVDLPSDPELIREACRIGEARSLLRRSLMAMTARRIHRQFDAAREIADRTRPIADAAIEAAHGRTREFCAYWYLQAGITQELAGEWAEATRMYRSGWQVRHSDEIGFSARDLAGKLAASSALRGETAEALSWLDEADSHGLPGLWVDPHLEVSSNMARLMLAVDALDRDRATETAQQLLQPVLHIDEFWSFVHLANARRLVAWGHAHDALDVLDDAAQMNRRTVRAGVHRGLWGAARADAMLAAGHASRAAGVLAGLAGTRFGVVSSARLRLLTGKHEAARHEAGLALDGSLWARERTELLLIDAAAAVGMGDIDAAAATMRTACERIVEHRHLHALATVSRTCLHELVPTVAPLGALLEQLEHADVAPIYPSVLELVEISPRERAVLEILAEGHTVAQVAKRLVVSPNTVKTQVRSLYTKLGVRSRDDVVREARALGLLPDN